VEGCHFRRPYHEGESCFDRWCRPDHRRIVMVFGPGRRRSPNRHRSSHWHWSGSWPGLSSALLLPAVSLLLSATVLLCPVSVWVCGSSPGVRATGPRLPSTGSGATAILLSAVSGIFDARTRSGAAVARTSRPDAIAAIVSPAGGRPDAIERSLRGLFSLLFSAGSHTAIARLGRPHQIGRLGLAQREGGACRSIVNRMFPRPSQRLPLLLGV